jgi:hypothetical protein
MRMTVSVRFSAEELDQLRHEARQSGMPLTVLVRRNALAQHHLPFACWSLRPANAPSSVPPDQEGPSGLQVSGYTGQYTVVVS